MTRLTTLLLAGFVLCAAATVDAGIFCKDHFLGRNLGLGWSDGYHAKCDCEDDGCSEHCGCRMYRRIFPGLFGTDGSWHDHGKVPTKPVSPGYFGCQDHVMPDSDVPAPVLSH